MLLMIMISLEMLPLLSRQYRKREIKEVFGTERARRRNEWFDDVCRQAAEECRGRRVEWLMMKTD